MHMALYNVAPDLQVSSAQLPGKLYFVKSVFRV